MYILIANGEAAKRLANAKELSSAKGDVTILLEKVSSAEEWKKLSAEEQGEAIRQALLITLRGSRYLVSEVVEGKTVNQVTLLDEATKPVQ